MDKRQKIYNDLTKPLTKLVFPSILILLFLKIFDVIIVSWLFILFGPIIVSWVWFLIIRLILQVLIKDE